MRYLFWIAIWPFAFTAGAAAAGDRESPTPPKTEAEPAPPAAPMPPQPADSTPLPTGAVARLGSAELRHGDTVRCLAFSPDGATLASGSASKDATVRLWDVATGREIRRISTPQGTIATVLFAPDGQTLVSGGGKGAAAYFWDVNTGDLRRQMTLNPAWAQIYSAVFSPDGTVLASGNTNGTISFWNPQTGLETGQLDARRDAGTRLDFSPDGRILLSWGTFSKKVRLWDIAGGRQSRELSGIDFSTGAVFFGDGSTFLTGGADGLIRQWSTVMGMELGTLAGHTGEITDLRCAPDGRTIVSAAKDNTIRIWDVIDGREMRRIDGLSRSPYIELSPDGKTIAARFADSPAIRLWDVATGRALFGGDEGDQPWNSAALSPDGKTLAAGQKGRVQLWDLTTGRLIRAFPVSRIARSVAFTADGGSVLVRSVRALGPTEFETTVRQWDIASGADTQRFRGMARGGCLSPDTGMLALWNYQTPMRLHNLATQEETTLLPSAPGRNLTSTFSADGGRFAVGFPGGEIHVWNVETGEELAVMQANGKRAGSLAFSPDGRTLACAPGAGRGAGPPVISLFDVDRGERWRTLSGHEGEITALAFSPNGRTIASCSKDRTVRLWSLTSGDQLAVFQDTGNTPITLTFSKDGRRLITGMTGCGGLIWRLPRR